MIIILYNKKDRHRLWPGTGGGPTVQHSWELCFSDKSLSFLSTGRSGSGESWRGGGHLFSFQSIIVLDQLQRDIINTAIRCVGAGFITLYFRGGAAIEQLCASIQAAVFSFFYSLLHERNFIASCPYTGKKIGESTWRSGCMRSFRPLLVYPYGEKMYESHEQFSALGFGTEVVKYQIFIKNPFRKNNLGVGFCSRYRGDHKNNDRRARGLLPNFFLHSVLR